ncbi:MAG: class I SAM-dependent methyltransferase [Ilumatobacter sp.]|nr:class I SAM-dependent methyltransferase [Ilumatobacter sp.]
MSTDGDHPDESRNYDYVIDSAMALAGPDGQVLDFGCGTGTLLDVAEDRGVGDRFRGVDTFEGLFAEWLDRTPPRVRHRVGPIEHSRIPLDDNSVSVVVANQVFEHIADPEPSLAEIYRVLQPGGAFLALFPTRDVWFEGHVRLYFAHVLRARPRLQRRYLRTMRRLGFGLDAEDSTLDLDQWTEHAMRTLHDVCFYHRYRDIETCWQAAFEAAPTSLEMSYMQYRLEKSRRLAPLAGIARVWPVSAVLVFVCRRRAGRVLLVRKPAVA